MSSLGLHIGLGASKVLAGHVGGVENRYDRYPFLAKSRKRASLPVFLSCAWCATCTVENRYNKYPFSAKSQKRASLPVFLSCAWCAACTAHLHPLAPPTTRRLLLVGADNLAGKRREETNLTRTRTKTAEVHVRANTDRRKETRPKKKENRNTRDVKKKRGRKKDKGKENHTIVSKQVGVFHHGGGVRGDEPIGEGREQHGDRVFRGCRRVDPPV